MNAFRITDFLISIPDRAAALSLKFFPGPYTWFIANLPMIKIISLVISAYFLYQIIYILIISKYFNSKLEEYMDAFMIGDLARHKNLLAYKDIMKAIKSNKPADWKNAVKGGIDLLDELMKINSVPGKTIDERLNNLNPELIGVYHGELLRAAALAKKIKKDDTFEVSRDEADEAVYVMNKAYKSFGLI
jgi:hypothetical protein